MSCSSELALEESRTHTDKLFPSSRDPLQRKLLSNLMLPPFTSKRWWSPLLLPRSWDCLLRRCIALLNLSNAMPIESSIDSGKVLIRKSQWISKFSLVLRHRKSSMVLMRKSTLEEEKWKVIRSWRRPIIRSCYRRWRASSCSMAFTCIAANSCRVIFFRS